jgi:hypothetical protein
VGSFFETGVWLFLLKLNKKGETMECPRCKNVFLKFKEILIMVDRSFYCHHCWSRLISYPHGEGKCRIEVDPLGEKWKKAQEIASAAQ